MYGQIVTNLLTLEHEGSKQLTLKPTAAGHQPQRVPFTSYPH